ncbi:MAG: hypothetical protein LBU32_11305 [Clostridiales bacterium]|jgi:hypothetical protein|nr:hypothetical protein [Clostridiales bacterium]
MQEEDEILSRLGAKVFTLGCKIDSTELTADAAVRKIVPLQPTARLTERPICEVHFQDGISKPV